VGRCTARAGDYSSGTLQGNVQRAIRWSCPAKVLLAVADLVVALDLKRRPNG
jgi:hypothetical protein